jgi:hypothetical protein
MQRPGRTADATGSTCGDGAMRREKDGGACGTAKFREETSKKADSATRGRIAAVHNVGDRIVRPQVIFCSAAFTKAGHRGYSTGSYPLVYSRKFRERRVPHPATKAGCCRYGGSEYARADCAGRAEDSCPPSGSAGCIGRPTGRLTPMASTRVVLPHQNDPWPRHFGDRRPFGR